MKIWINNKKIEIFSGARVVDALRSCHLDQSLLLADPEKMWIKDNNGHPVSIDGELTDGDRLFIELKEEDENK